MKILIMFLIAINFFLSSCSSSTGADPTTESALFEIYVATEIYGGDRAFAVVKKYNLEKRENLTKYYEALRNYSTNEEKWEDFLKRVNQAKERQTN